MNLFIDLDGTLLDSKQRLYQLFNDLIVQSELTYNDYWSLKYEGLNHHKILQEKFGFSIEEISSFEVSWMKAIESSAYLKLDIPFSGIQEWLALKKSKYNLYLVTARQSIDAVNRQLVECKIYEYFDQILVTEQKKTKEQLIKEANIVLTENDWLIGDTGYDVLTARSLSINSLSVLSGFMSKDSLVKYQPDLILDSIIDFDKCCKCNI